MSSIGSLVIVSSKNLLNFTKLCWQQFSLISYRLQEVQGVDWGDCWVTYKERGQGRWRWFFHGWIAGEAHCERGQIWGKWQVGVNWFWQSERNQIWRSPSRVVGVVSRRSTWCRISLCPSSGSLVPVSHEIWLLTFGGELEQSQVFGLGLVWFGPGLVLLKTWSPSGLWNVWYVSR